MPSSPARGWSRPEPRLRFSLRSWSWLAVQRAAQLLRHVKQRLIMLHQVLGAVEARHRACGDLAAQAERDEAVEDRLVAPAEQPFVIVGSDPEVERAIVAPGIVVDDVAHQDQSGAVTRARPRDRIRRLQTAVL